MARELTRLGPLAAEAAGDLAKCVNRRYTSGFAHAYHDDSENRYCSTIRLNGPMDSVLTCERPEAIDFIEALGAIGPAAAEVAIPQLQIALQDKRLDVRLAAAEALDDVSRNTSGDSRS